MAMPAIVRDYKPADREHILDLDRASKGGHEGAYGNTHEELVLALTNAGQIKPENVLVAAEWGRIAGYGIVVPEPPLRRAVIDFLTREEHAGTAVEESLLAGTVQRAVGRAVEMAHVNVAEHRQATRGLLKRLGFREVRTYLELACPAREAGRGDPPGDYRRLEPGEEGTLAELQNSAFAGCWGYSPISAEDVTRRLALGDCSHQDILLLPVHGSPVAYCWTTLRTEARGRIHMIGVAPSQQGRGLGRKVLELGLWHVRQRRATRVEVTVDSENRAARALYERAGFQAYLTTLWYERKLR